MNTLKIKFLLVFITAGIFSVIPAVFSLANAQSITYHGSAQYSTGNYIFTDRTNSYYLFNGLTLSEKYFQMTVTLPVIHQNTSFISYLGPIVIPTGGKQSGMVVNRKGKNKVTIIDTSGIQKSGVGDPNLHFDLLLAGKKGNTSIHLLADMKFPVASFDSGFGTGEWDYGAGLSVNHRAGRFFIFADATYWILGDPPDLKLIDPVSYGIATGYLIPATKLGIMASFSGSTKIIDNVDPPAYVGAGINLQAAQGIGLSLGSTFGLTNSTPDFSLTFGWSVTL